MNYYNNKHLQQRLITNSTINQETGCWEWNLNKNKVNGYGQMWIGTAPDGKYIWNSSHRTSYLVFNGPIADGLEVAHKCHNPKCCNPDHLVAATHQDNIKMSVDAGRTIKGTDKKQAKLTDAEVRTIKQGSLFEHLTQAAVARLFGISPSTLRSILTGHSWAHIEA